LKTIGDKVEPSSNDACVALPTGWRLHIADSCENASRFAGRTLALLLRDKPNLLLCAATGGSPARTYEEFVDAVMADPALLHPLRLLKLDEWGGLAMDDRATCEAYLRERLVDPLRIPEERFISFRSDALSPAVECHRIERWLLDHGPIDVCVLGLGLNGHLGFNEPAHLMLPGFPMRRLPIRC
jgi:galactosamine-6-phosphate isomerase